MGQLKKNLKTSFCFAGLLSIIRNLFSNPLCLIQWAQSTSSSQEKRCPTNVQRYYYHHINRIISSQLLPPLSFCPSFLIFASQLLKKNYSKCFAADLLFETQSGRLLAPFKILVKLFSQVTFFTFIVFSISINVVIE